MGLYILDTLDALDAMDDADVFNGWALMFNGVYSNASKTSGVLSSPSRFVIMSSCGPSDMLTALYSTADEY